MFIQLKVCIFRSIEQNSGKKFDLLLVWQDSLLLKSNVFLFNIPSKAVGKCLLQYLYNEISYFKNHDKETYCHSGKQFCFEYGYNIWHLIKFS